MSSAAPRPRTILGHPPGLYVLFFTEMWERFSYYGMRALLILYMVNYFKWAQKDASTVYKVYTSLVYVTPILGGYLADRYLGNRLAVIIGASLMAVGHFLMAFEEYPVFLAALAFLIVGNGMFKPNMSTQVGRLYPKNDGRVDAAYTIFYMGINLGAFLAPLVCGWLAENTVGGYHAGFTAAGIGMVCGLAIYLIGQPLIRELPHDTVAVDVKRHDESGPKPLTEAEAAAEPSIFGPLAALVPAALAVLGVGLVVAAPLLWKFGHIDPWDALMLGIAGCCSALAGHVTAQVRGGLRDRVVSILLLGLFVIFFWAAYEQAGNVLNLWADKHTDRYLTRPMEPPPVFPVVHEDALTGGAGETPGIWQRFTSLFRLKVDANRPAESWGEWLVRSINPVPTTWFQAINALAIFVIAPLFAWLWIWLDRRGWQPSIPVKMFLGLVLMSASVAVMIQAARQEDRETTVRFDGPVPPGIEADANGILGHRTDKGGFERFHAGRLSLRDNRLHLQGVLPDNERDHLVERSAPVAYRDKVDELVKSSESLLPVDTIPVAVRLDPPPGFDLRQAGLKRSVVFHAAEDGMLIARVPLRDKERKGLLVAGGEPRFRDAVNELHVESARWRVSSSWLFWSYILATLGELCLSPVGLSMVSKLAPARFATMLMGVWFLTTALGNFAAGALGEVWGHVPPVDFFLYTTAAVAAAAVILLVITRPLARMMHGVR